jgi:hypothetical protein
VKSRLSRGAVAVGSSPWFGDRFDPGGHRDETLDPMVLSDFVFVNLKALRMVPESGLAKETLFRLERVGS